VGGAADRGRQGLRRRPETAEIRAHRGTLTEPGRESPYRSRSVTENLRLLEWTRAGEFPDGARVLRAKIDMASPNLNLRDPTMYRIGKMPATQAPTKTSGPR